MTAGTECRSDARRLVWLLRPVDVAGPLGHLVQIEHALAYSPRSPAAP